MHAKFPSVDTLASFILSCEQALEELTSRSSQIISARMLGGGYLVAGSAKSFASEIAKARQLQEEVSEAILQVDKLIDQIRSTPEGTKSLEKAVQASERTLEALINKLEGSFKHVPYPAAPRWFDAVIPQILQAFAKMASAVVRCAIGNLMTAYNVVLSAPR